MEDAQIVRETPSPEFSKPSNGNGEAVMNPVAKEEANPGDKASEDASDVPSVAQGDLPAGNSASTFSDVVTEKELDGPSLAQCQLLPSQVLASSSLDAVSAKDVEAPDGPNLAQDQLLPTEISPSISSNAVAGKETEAPNDTLVVPDQLLQTDIIASTPSEDVSANQSAANHLWAVGKTSAAEMRLATSNGAQSQYGDSALIAPVRVRDVILPHVSSSDTVTTDSTNDYYAVPAGETAASQGKIVTNVVVSSPESSPLELADITRALVDTTAPFESVKEAVSKFGGIVDWKAHKIQSTERQKVIEQELEKAREEMPAHRRQCSLAEDAKAQVMKELDSTKSDIEELKLRLERAQTEERQAKQDSELAKLRVEEMEQGIAAEASVAAKAQLEVAKARHTAAVSELNTVKGDLEALQNEYASLIIEKEVAVKTAEEAAWTSKEIEKTVEELTIELVSTRESLESAHAVHLEAEEQRMGAAMAREQDSLNWEKELKLAEEELERLNQQILLAADLKSKLSTSSALLHDLKDELAGYMESKHDQDRDRGGKPHSEVEEREDAHNDIQATIDSAKKELEEVKLRLEKETSQVSCLNVMCSSLKSELEKESLALATTKQREGMASVVVASLEAEVEKIKTETALVQSRENEAKAKMVELPKQLQQAAEEADHAKLLAQVAHQELHRVEGTVDQAKATAIIVESRLLAAKKETEAARASEKLAIAAVRALKESESAQSIHDEGSPTGVTLPLEEYYELSKRAHEAEEAANVRVAAAISNIEAAKLSESRVLKRLEEASSDLAATKEVLDNAMQKAEKAKAGKLGMEQELRKWRAEHERRRKLGESDVLRILTTGASPRPNIEGSNVWNPADQASVVCAPVHRQPSPKAHVRSNSIVSEELTVRKKKKPFFPRLLMFFARRKVQKVA